jgi:signal transduction histidine kinase
MLRYGRPRPVPILVVASLYSLAFIIDAAFHPETGDLMDPTPVVIITMVAAILANVAARRTRLLISWLAMIGTAVLIIHLAARNEPIPTVTETLTTVMVAAVALFMIAEAHKSLDDSKARYARLLDAAPLGVLEMDVSSSRRILDEAGLGVDDLRRRIHNDDSFATGLAHSVCTQSISQQLVGLMGAQSTAHAEQMLRSGAVHPNVRDFLESFFVDTVLGGRDGEYVLPMGQGRFSIARWWLHGPASDEVTAILVDITAQKRIEHSLESEIDSKNRFIASVSHELRTPLTAVVGLVEELVGDTGFVDERERRELLEIVARQARDVAGIVEDLLVAARAESNGLTIAAEPLDVDELIRGILPTYGPDVAYKGAQQLMVIGDAGRLRQVLRNLLTNAERYGGPERRVETRLNDGVVEIEVRDSGGGIGRDEARKMFEPYARSHDRPGRPDSVGLGLTVSRDLARMMGGDLTYRHDGRESIFHLALPAVVHAPIS